jgi:transposase
VPDAEQKMVFDQFHIMQHVGKVVDRARKDEQKALMSRGDDTLACSKYLWLYSA